MNTLLDRFCRYVEIETTADENASTYPSTSIQLDLGRVLADELRELALDDVKMSEDGIVTATIPGNIKDAPVIAWFAHMDTSPEVTGKNVNPLVHENYDGNDITLPGDKSKIIRVVESAGLAELRGKTLITTDGTTLLGADDKSGIAVIMTAADYLMRQKGLPRPTIRVVFTCDEEIGRGTDKLDLDEIGAVVGYTLDGEGQGNVENETFSADQAVITITGKNIHPAIAKDRMINAVRLAADFIARLPQVCLTPETTELRNGFIHPYVIEGGVAVTTIRAILRSFDTAELADHAALLRDIARTVTAAHPGAEINIEIKNQYRNMKDVLSAEPRAVDLAAAAMRKVGIEPKFQSIRGGTDGSRLSEMGLPTPNLSTGMHNYHSPLEYACLEEMQTAVDVLVELARLWSAEK